MLSTKMTSIRPFARSPKRRNLKESLNTRSSKAVKCRIESLAGKLAFLFELQYTPGCIGLVFTFHFDLALYMM